MSGTTTCWHVTSREAAGEILEHGFLGGWGDAGFGVYLYDDASEARSYAADGGWDGSLQDPVIIQLDAPNEELSFVIPDPGWPNPEDYEHVLWVAMNPDNNESHWKPKMALL